MLTAPFRDRPARAWVVAALLLALLSLPLGHALAFDASAWVVWGRELWSLDLQTGAGPSWKPFPVLVTAPLAVLGDAAAGGWLVVARAGALLAVVGAARLAARAAGGWGAAVAAATLLLSPWWLLNGALGNADPILGALVVWGVLAAGEGRPRTAFWLGVAGALIRPEAWPFLALYALVLVRRGELPLRTAVLAALGVLALWVVPDALSSGLASTSGATGTPSVGSAALTAFPFGTVLVDLGRQASWVGLAAALVAGAASLAAGRATSGAGREAPGVRGAGREAAGVRGAASGAGRGTADGDRPTAVPLALRPATWLVVALAYALLVAVMAQVGFAGNPRYLVPALVPLAAATGAAVAVLDGHAPRGARALLGAALLLALAIPGAGAVRDQARALGDRAELRRALFRAVDRAGGHEGLTAAGPVRSGDPTLRALVAEATRQSVPAASASRRPGDRVARPTPSGGWALR